jgi:hypothetical protein
MQEAIANGKEKGGSWIKLPNLIDHVFIKHIYKTAHIFSSTLSFANLPQQERQPLYVIC